MNLTVDQERSDEALKAAATIWARATARRDRLPDVPAAADKLPGIISALEATGASLHLARQGTETVGFALVVPSRDTLELRYVAVDPAAWGNGVAVHLLGHVADRARAANFAAVTLWVLEDNARAVAVYEREGWRRTTDVKSQIADRRVERRLELTLG